MSPDKPPPPADLSTAAGRSTAAAPSHAVGASTPDVGASTPAGQPDAADREAPGPDVVDATQAAALALARAREAARAKGLRPGSKPRRSSRHIPPDARRSGPHADARDPSLLGDQMDRLLSDRGWEVDLSVGAVMGRWPAIVGGEVAQHSAPVTFEQGVLTVRAESTAWATNLRLLSSTILARLEAEAGPGTVTTLRIVGPSAPSWVRGPRRSQGPGPRDTYG